MKRLELTEQEERARQALDLLKRLTDKSDGEIGATLGVKHQAIAQRRTGFTRIHPWRDVPKLAKALGVDPQCFEMSPEKLLEWITENRPDLLVRALSWIVGHSIAA